MKRFIAVLFMVLLLQSQVFATVIPTGTLVIVQPYQTIDADDVKVGDNVSFKVHQPVKVNNEVVIKTGTEIQARVIKKKNNGILGIPGEIQIGEFQIITPNSESLRLTGMVSDEGENRYWANVGWIFVLPLLFIKGNDGKIPCTSTYMLHTAESFDF